MSIPSTSELIKKYQLNTKKSLGQNFILDKNFTDKIAKSAIAKSADDLSEFEVLEIGAGPGGLTRSILDAGVKKLVVIEKDQRCILALQELKSFYGARLEIVEGDALEIDETKLFNSTNKFKIIANLPYNIGTPLIFKWLKISDKIASMNLMLQKEVVERIVAKQDEKNYGRLAVMIGFLCESKMLFTVNKSVFVPPPKVTSAVVKIIPRTKSIADVDFTELEKVVACAFNQRRKMIKSALKPIFPNAEEVLLHAKISPTLRAENLSILDFCELAKLKHGH